MVNIYESMADDNLTRVNGRTKLFIKTADETGNIEAYDYGIACVPESTGSLFIVDEWLIDQLGKVQFKDGTLSVKEGMELEPPVKSEKQLQIEAIERQLEALKAEPDEPVDTEGHTDAPLLDYIDEPAE